MGQKDKRDILKESPFAFCFTLKCLMATCNFFHSNHNYSRHRHAHRESGGQASRLNSPRLTCVIVSSALPVWGACVVGIQWGGGGRSTCQTNTPSLWHVGWSDNKRRRRHLGWTSLIFAEVLFSCRYHSGHLSACGKLFVLLFKNSFLY